VRPDTARGGEKGDAAWLKKKGLPNAKRPPWNPWFAKETTAQRAQRVNHSW
jgi:hypothetical protein